MADTHMFLLPPVSKIQEKHYKSLNNYYFFQLPKHTTFRTTQLYENKYYV